VTVRKIAVGSAGTLLVLAGLALLVLPGPGVLLIALGLIVLSLEFEWAVRLIRRIGKWLRKEAPGGKESERRR
jgi:Putative transmembrane protein (PGPGW)